MSDRISVGSTYKNAGLILPLIVAVVLIGMEALWGREWGTQGAVALIGGVALLLAAIAWGVIFRRRRWLEVGEDGFRIEGPGLSQEWRDADVATLAWSTKRNYVNGLPSSETCVLEIRDAEGRLARMREVHPLQVQSRFVQFAGRVFEGLCVRTRDQLGRGGEVQGEGWTLVRDTLQWKGGELKVEEMSGVAEFDGQLRVWRKGSDEAAFGVGAGTVNATLLRSMLDERRPKDKGGGEESGSDLGRILFERRGGRGKIVIYALGALLLVLGALFVLEAPGLGVGLIATGLVCGFGGWWNSGVVFRCHERGVSRKTRSKTTTIRYRDTAVFTYQATRQFVNGAYAGTSMLMEFLSGPDPELRRIRWSASVQGLDEELETLRLHISKVMAAGWMEQLAAGKTVDWTSNLRLLPDGLEFRPSGFFGHKDWTKAVFADLAGTSMEQGTFHLFLKSQPKAVLSERVSAPNFFPGYIALTTVLEPQGKP